MGYREWRVSPGVDVWQSVGPPREQRILPDGCLDLLHVDGRLVVAGPDAVARVHVPTSAGTTTAVTTTAVTTTAVRLHGGLGARLLEVRADELVGRTVPLVDLWGDARARRLAESVAPDPTRGLAHWAAEARGAAATDPFGWRLRALLGRGGSVEAAATAFGCSSRQLRRRALELYGYGPQRLSRVLRLGRVVADADRGVAWAEIAARRGFADQQHLAREVRALTGVTPTQLRRERRVRSVHDGA